MEMTPTEMEKALEALEKWWQAQDVNVLSDEEKACLRDAIGRFCECAGIDLPDIQVGTPDLTELPFATFYLN